MNSEKLASTAAKEKGLLDSLIANSRLYSSSKAYKELLDFVVRLRGFAPFNAMLLHIQKPGLTYAASARDWRERFKRTIKNDSRPLLILWPFSPIALVYDVQDTEGEKIPDRAFGFTATGGINDFAISSIYKALRSLGISVDEFDAGANRAGVIRLTEEAREKRPRKYAISLNRNYAPAAKFATLVHEMGHLWLGHLGSDERLKILDRSDLQKPQMEIEAESVAYILCHRNGVDVKSDQYLSGYIDGKESFCDLEIHRILQVAGQIESRLELAERISWDLGHSTGRDDGQPPNLGVTSSIPNSIQSSALPLQLQPPPLPQPTPLDASSLVDASIQLASAIQLFVRTLLKSVYSWLKRHKT